jgi:uncharacterized protein (DUF1800 family)
MEYFAFRMGTGLISCMTPSHRIRRLAVFTAASLLLGVSGTVGAKPETDIPKNPDARTISHVLNRLTFGARPGDIERVQQMGLSAFIEQQLHPERIADAVLAERLAGFQTLAMSSADLARDIFVPAAELRRDQQLKQQRAAAQAQAKNDEMMGTTQPPVRPQDLLTPEQRQIQQAQQNVVNELMQAKILRATLSERQLEEVLVDFWFNHFNVFVGKGQVRQYLSQYERDAIRPNVLGNFRDLLGATAHSPAMLFYLDNFQSQAPEGAMVLAAQNNRVGDLRRKPGQPITRPGQVRPGQVRPGQNPGQIQFGNQQPPKPPQRQRPGLNENYARELMELHTLGVDGGYTQKDVVELARILTGWTIDRPQAGGEFVFRPQTHDAGEKILLGTKFPAGKGLEEGERALDLLARHPSTAQHISFKLAQRFVADEPPKSLVDRAAKKFLDTKGDLREVTRLIITSPEFFSANSYRAKIKTPLEFVASAARAVNANVVNPQSMIQALRTDLGMPLYGCQPPTGYSMTADAWVNTGALLNRMNFAVQLLAGGFPQRQTGPGRAGQPGTPPNQAGVAPNGRPAGPPPPGRGRAGQAGPGPFQLRPGQLARAPIQVDTMTLAPDTTDATQDQVIRLILAGDASSTTRATLARADSPQSLIALTLGSPEFQRR